MQVLPHKTFVLWGRRLISVPRTVLMYSGECVSFPTLPNTLGELKNYVYVKGIFSNPLRQVIDYLRLFH